MCSISLFSLLVYQVAYVQCFTVSYLSKDTVKQYHRSVFQGKSLRILYILFQKRAHQKLIYYHDPRVYLHQTLQ